MAIGSMASGFPAGGRRLSLGVATIMALCLWAAPTSARGWPDVAAHLEDTGGGDRDAAVIAGIERYAMVAAVPGARANAQDWYAFLTGPRGVPPSNVQLLLDERATADDLRAALKQAASQAKRGGRIWFVFIGHGVPSRDGRDGLLVGFDAQQRANLIESRSLPRSEAVALMAEKRGVTGVAVIDACFSGRASDGKPLLSGLQPLVAVREQKDAPPRVAVLTAAAGDQFAGALPGAGRPAFSYLVLGALRGWADADDDGRVSAAEVRDYADRALLATLRDRRQTPDLLGEGRLDLGPSGGEEGPDLRALAAREAVGGGTTFAERGVGGSGGSPAARVEPSRGERSPAKRAKKPRGPLVFEAGAGGAAWFGLDSNKAAETKMSAVASFGWREADLGWLHPWLDVALGYGRVKVVPEEKLNPTGLCAADPTQCAAMESTTKGIFWLQALQEARIPFVAGSPDWTVNAGLGMYIAGDTEAGFLARGGLVLKYVAAHLMMSAGPDTGTSLGAGGGLRFRF
jgi:hypothetical protein